MTSSIGRCARGAAFMTAAIALTACAGRLTPRPEVFQAERVRTVQEAGEITLVLVTPVTPKPAPVLLLFASGDGGLLGLSRKILQHLAETGYYVAGYSSREALRAARPSGEGIRLAKGVSMLAAIKQQAKAKLGLPPGTPVVVAGLSRGANMVVFAAGNPTLNADITGAIAIALTRELDYLEVPQDAVGRAGIEVDEEGRALAYPAVRRLGSIPLAIIQSTHDGYVPSAESRKLLGPDTPTLRLYEVPSTGHTFGGGEAVMLKDLDHALAWILTSK